METPHPSGRTDLADLRSGDRRSLRIASKRAVPYVLLAGERRRTTGNRRTGPPMAKRPALRIPSPQSDLSSPSQGEGKRVIHDSDRSSLDEQAMDGGDNSTSLRPTPAASVTQGLVVPGERRDIPSLPGPSSSLGLARERLNLDTAGLHPRVIETIQNARAVSTRNLYSAKWRVFESWCDQYTVIPYQCSVSEVLRFLQELLDKGRAFSTVKVYLAAISACHVGFGNAPVGQHPLVCRFMRGARRLRPAVKSLVPSWDLSVVLEALSQHPFEPLDTVDMRLLSFKTVLLLALSSAKRVSDLHALSVHPACMQFAPGSTKVCLLPNPAFVPKVLDSTTTVELSAFHPPPFSSPEEQRLHTLCPVRALRIYLDRTKVLGRGNQLFVSWAPPFRGKPISRQRLSHWIVQAIVLAYNNRGLQAPEGLKAHSTRGMATSWALFRGVSVQDICAAASWSSPHTFIRFYRLDVTAPCLAHSVLSVGPPTLST